MSLGRRKAKKLSVQPAKGPNSDINMTPLVDVVLVLLIIFMVVTPLLEKDIGVRVPATEQVEQHDEVPPDQLVVKVKESGELQINSEKVPEAEYIDRLKGVLSRKPANEKIVFVLADDKASYARVVAACDGAKQAGAETLGMATELPPDAAMPAPAPNP
jgi:biopolymer transport protein ExbD